MTMIYSFLVFSISVVILQVVGAQEPSLEDCKGGTCPSPGSTTSSSTTSFSSASTCGLWLAPSPIKNEESHGFGLGMFTSKYIPKGTTVESMYGAGSEPLLPIYANTFKHHPPLREYIWGADEMPETTTDYPKTTNFLFMPGLGAIVPCTSVNYNLEWSGPGLADTPRYDVAANSFGIDRGQDATAGSFTYRQNVTYTAVRDIVPGEELTVQCIDDDFDGGAYYLSRFVPNNETFICLDQNVVAKPSTIPHAGKGLFAKRTLLKDDVLISTPLIPLHRTELLLKKPRHETAPPVPTYQQLLNYCYGHVSSDLLLLPYGPLVSYINHDGANPNAILRWHAVDTSESKELVDLRLQHHHPELLSKTGERVAMTHGKGLMVDLVALRDVQPGEEIFLDYGSEWTAAWEKHQVEFQEQAAASEKKDYMHASTYLEKRFDGVHATLEEGGPSNLPSNLQIMCFHSRRLRDVEEEQTSFFGWGQDDVDTCLRPCKILERYEGDAEGEFRYTVQLSSEGNGIVRKRCRLAEEQTMVVVTNMPSSAIRILNKPWMSDEFLSYAFRHEIQVPAGLYPDNWMRKKLRGPRGRHSAVAAPAQEKAQEFKRKQQVAEDVHEEDH